MNKNKSCTNIRTIHWFSLDNKGIILSNNTPLDKIIKKKAGIYIYQLLPDKKKIYIGSSCNVEKRIAQHRHNINNNSKTCPKFYNFVKKYGWFNFRLGILEYINILDIKNKYEIKKVIFDREQCYLDKMNPTLNINKIAGSMLGYKQTKEMKNFIGLQSKGKSMDWTRKDYVVYNETKNSLPLRSRNGVKVKVFDESNNLVKEFPTIVSAAKYYDVNPCTISKWIKFGSSMKNLQFKTELKDVMIWVLDKQYKTIAVFPTAKAAVEFCGTSHVNIGRYLKSKKLWKNKYYFSRTSYFI